MTEHEFLIEQKIVERIQDFDVSALLDLLHSLGYRDTEIEYRSHATNLSPRALLQAIEFQREPERRVFLTVNLGLLSAQNPLPSYFLKVIEQQQDEALTDYLRFFDQRLLDRRFAGLYPERDRTLFADWGETRMQLLRLPGLQSLSTLHWMFRLVYPELGVSVRRSRHWQQIRTSHVILGSTVLGGPSAFGGVATVPVWRVDISLSCEEPDTFTGVPWATEAARRLNAQIAPILAECELSLNVYLLLRDRKTWVRLQDDKRHFLGFDPLSGSSNAEDTPETPETEDGDGEERIQQVILHQGEFA